MILHNIAPIEEGETIYSYLMRMSYINGMDVKDFLNSIYSFSDVGKTIRHELNKDLFKLTTPLQYSQQELLIFFIKHSLLPIFLLTHSSEQTVRYINKGFRAFNKSMKPESALSFTIPNNTNFCPECMKESIKKTGFPVFYREHQVPGVKKCHKHNVTLKEYIGERGKEYEQYQTHSRDFTITDDAYETKYADFTSNLLNAEIDISWIECETLIKRLLREKCKGTEYKRFETNCRIGTFDAIMSALLFLFDSVDELNTAFAEFKTSSSEQKKHLPTVMRCPVCGIDYITSLDAINMGWGCPNCDKDKTSEQIISKLIETVGKGQYQLKKVTDGRNVEIVHKNCFWGNNVISLQYTDFIYNGKRCSCDTVKMNRWKENYKAAEEYYKEHGNLLVPFDFVTETGINLGHWIRSQRQGKKKGTLIQGKIMALDLIGMVWSVLDKQFEDMFRLAEKYYKEHGNLLVPKGYITKTGERLGGWIATQRQRKKTGLISQEEIVALESIGMSWRVLDEKFEAMYRLAEKYYEEHGHLIIPGSYVTETGERLGGWVGAQRQRKKNGTISQEEIEALDEIGMSWDVPGEKFEAMYRIAKEYYLEHGNLLVQYKYITETGVNLGSWIYWQRKRKKSGAISQEEIEKLEAIGMVWDVHEAHFEENYMLAKEHFKQHGNLLIPAEYVTETGVKLGSWLQRQKRRKREGTMSPERIEKLEAIGMV